MPPFQSCQIVNMTIVTNGKSCRVKFKARSIMACANKVTLCEFNSSTAAQVWLGFIVSFGVGDSQHLFNRRFITLSRQQQTGHNSLHVFICLGKQPQILLSYAQILFVFIACPSRLSLRGVRLQTLKNNNLIRDKITKN